MSQSISPRFVFKDGTAVDLHTQLAPLGVDVRLSRRLQAVMMRQRLTAVPHQMPEVPGALLRRVAEHSVIPSLTLLDKTISPRDGFVKYLFRGEGDEPFESVRIPLLHRPGDEKYIVCVSSQVGCALACAFCATGRMGFKRNLSPWEIVDQVMHIQGDSDYSVRGVVFMGMGEPMLNYDRVMKAAEILNESCGLAIDAKAITISTAGVVPGIRRFTRERKPYRLIVSLSSANSEKRRQLMPIEETHPLPELMDAVREYQAVSGRRVTLAWTMLSGINTNAEDVRQIAELTGGLPIQIDLIDVNDSTGRFTPPTREELKHFRDTICQVLRQPMIRRYSGGQDIAGACGMLAGLSLPQIAPPEPQPKPEV